MAPKKLSLPPSSAASHGAASSRRGKAESSRRGQSPRRGQASPRGPPKKSLHKDRPGEAAAQEIAEPSEVHALNTLLARLSLIPHAELIQLAAAAIATCPDAEHRRQFAAAADKAATAAEDERASSLALKAHVEAAGPAEVTLLDKAPLPPQERNADQEVTKKAVAAAKAECRSKQQEAAKEAEAVELPKGSTWRKHGGAELEPLLVFTTLVCVRWLLKFAKGEISPTWEGGCKGVVPAWQQLPKVAHVTAATLRRSKWSFGLPVGVLSYGWAARDHPDPTGEQLQRLVPLLEAIVAACDEKGGPEFSWGIMWDFMSLPQRGRTSGYDKDVDDRTPEQQARFQLGLSHVNIWYGAMYTHTLVLNTPMPAGAENSAEYGRRGWCIFECLLSSIVSNMWCYLELDKMDGLTTGWDGIRNQCAAKRPAPMAPDEFEAMIRNGMDAERAVPGSGIKFTNGKDATEVVIPQYEEGFVRLLGEASYMAYASLGWGDAEVRTLARAFAYAHAKGAMAQLPVQPL